MVRMVAFCALVESLLLVSNSDYCDRRDKKSLTKVERMKWNHNVDKFCHCQVVISARRYRLVS